MGTRRGYKALSLLGDAKAARRGPGAFVRRQGRKRANRIFNRLLRKALRP